MEMNEPNISEQCRPSDGADFAASRPHRYVRLLRATAMRRNKRAMRVRKAQAPRRRAAQPLTNSLVLEVTI